MSAKATACSANDAMMADCTHSWLVSCNAATSALLEQSCRIQYKMLQTTSHSDRDLIVMRCFLCIRVSCVPSELCCLHASTCKLTVTADCGAERLSKLLLLLRYKGKQAVGVSFGVMLQVMLLRVGLRLCCYSSTHASQLVMQCCWCAAAGHAAPGLWQHTGKLLG